MEARPRSGAMATGSSGGGWMGGSTRQLAHLENILQELTRHEARTTTESVERTSAMTQQRLLKDQLFRGKRSLTLCVVKGMESRMTL